MRITWNESESSFEAELDRSNFHDDLDKVKNAGFKTTGPPLWKWHTQKVNPLRAIRENRPLNLFITTEALEQFQKKDKEQTEKDVLIAQYKEAKKKLDGPKPKRRVQKSLNPQETHYKVPYVKYAPPLPPPILCIFCCDPVYDIYEKVEPLSVCLWCEKTIMDEQDGL